MGWALLAEEPGRYVVMGAACQPWVADVVFTPIAPAEFSAAAPPDQVKIVWTLEAEPMDQATSRLGSETRVVATDDQGGPSFSGTGAGSGSASC
jgi:hypothetical protein